MLRRRRDETHERRRPLDNIRGRGHISGSGVDHDDQGEEPPAEYKTFSRLQRIRGGSEEEQVHESLARSHQDGERGRIPFY